MASKSHPSRGESTWETCGTCPRTAMPSPKSLPSLPGFPFPSLPFPWESPASPSLPAPFPLRLSEASSTIENFLIRHVHAARCDRDPLGSPVPIASLTRFGGRDKPHPSTLLSPEPDRAGWRSMGLFFFLRSTSPCGFPPGYAYGAPPSVAPPVFGVFAPISDRRDVNATVHLGFGSHFPIRDGHPPRESHV